MNASIAPFWNHVIRGYFQKDIEQLEAIQLVNAEYGNCTVPQFLAVSSTLELLGKLLREGDRFSGQPLPAWQYYFEHYLPDLIDLLNPIQDLVRNGTAHLFLPRYMGVTKDPNSNEIIILGSDGIPSLNVTVFTTRFVGSLNKVELDLTNDALLADRFAKKLIHMADLHRDLFDKHKGDIDRYLTNNPPIPTTNHPMTTVYPTPTQLPLPNAPQTPVTKSLSD